MKKVLIILSAALMLCCVAGCTENTPEPEEVITDEVESEEIVEEIISLDTYETLEEMNEAADVNIIPLDNVKDEIFEVKNKKAAVYSFTRRDMNYILAATKDLNMDIMEVYDKETAVPEAGAPVFYTDEEMKLARFAYDGVQYNFVARDEGYYSQFDFVELVKEWMDSIVGEDVPEINSFTGLYFEKVMKGSLQVYPADKENVYISIAIPRDEDSFDSWSMKARLSGNKLIYERSEHYLENLTDNTSIAVNDGVGGYLEINEDKDKLSWNGSGNIDTMGYIFNKDTEQ